MAPFFTVITANNPHSAHIIDTLTKVHSSPFVDGISQYTANFKQKYADMNGKFYTYENEKLYGFDYDELDLIIPHFILTFDKGVKVEKDDYVIISQYLVSVLNGKSGKAYVEKFKQLVILPDIVYHVEKTKADEPVLKEEYAFCYVLDSETDIAYCQITKPYTPEPYTVVIRNYSEKAFTPLFTDLYVCTSWGVCNHDAVFLQKLWVMLDMEKDYGPLDLENRLKKAIYDCTPREGYTPKPEPEVYRLDYLAVQKRNNDRLKKKRLLE